MTCWKNVLWVSGVCTLLLAGCETDSGTPTKRSECGRLLVAVCDHGADLGCGSAADAADCRTDSIAVCAAQFDDSCRATSDDVHKVDHDIKNIIQSKETCDGLESILGYLADTLSTMAAGPCG